MSGIQQLLGAGGGVSGSVFCGQTTVGYSTLTGFNPTYGIGVISPTTLFGATITEFDTSSLGGNFTLSVSGSVPNGLFSTLTVAGVTLPASSALYSNSGSSTSWTWYTLVPLSNAQVANFIVS